MMNLRSIGRASWLPVLISLAACSSEETGPQAGAELRVSVPAFISSVRSVDLSALTATLELNGESRTMTRSGDVWSTTVSVAANSTHTLSLSWSETVRGRALPLGQYSTSVSVGESAQTVVIASEDYNSEGFDLDGDGVSNLQERALSTNPFLDNTLAGAVDVVIPRLPEDSAAPTLDGRIASSEWRYAVTADSSGASLLINNLMFEEDQGADQADGVPKSRWSAIHDGTYLYLLVVADDNGTRRYDSDDAWDDDNLNIYLDGGYSHTSSYNADGQDNDIHLLIPLLNESGAPNDSSNSGRFHTGVNSSTEFNTSGSKPDFAFSNAKESSGEQGARGNQMDVYEFRISLDRLGISGGGQLGIDLHLDDDDNGGERDSKWAWFHPSGSASDSSLTNDNTYSNPTFMARAALEN
ncbi:sugar-binding protein [Granulosicoccaceae sp. 1_MG-2023]|nr:sugar-binding protein [Granulosicoccaceae sp. 1_MG-2023]